MRVLVAGAGIGGLTAALSLHHAGIRDVEVVESSRRIDAIGAGINLLPHAVRELTELGLGDALRGCAIETAELIYHDRFGTPIHREPRGRAAGYRWAQYSIHRGALQRVLLEAVRERLGAGAVRCGLALERFDQSSAAVRAELRERGSGGRVRGACADVLVGADGIDSAVRAQLHPGEGPPRWEAIAMWRGVSEAEPFLGGRSMIMAGSNTSAKFVAYPIGTRAGRALVNWVAEVRLAHDDAAAGGCAREWAATGDRDAVLEHFADWDFGWLDVPGLIAAAPAILEYPMVDRDPLRSWGSGRVTLLGDAAHPMYPIGSNGASQAIIDARVLARELAAGGDPAAALAAYETARRPVTNALVLANRRHGPERVLSLVAERAPDGFADIEDVIPRAELAAIVAGYRRTAGFDVEELNTRASWSVSEA